MTFKKTGERNRGWASKIAPHPVLNIAALASVIGAIIAQILITPFGVDTIVTSTIITITVALVCATITVLSITISLQRQEYFGVSLQEIRKLRQAPAFNFLTMLLISVLITFGISLTFLLGFYVVMFDLIVCLFVYLSCFAIQELPLLIDSENQAKRILKRQYRANRTNHTKTDMANINFAIENAIFTKSLFEAYQMFADKEADTDLMDDLLALQENHVRNLVSSADKVKQIANMTMALQNVKSIMQEDSPFAGIMPDYRDYAFRMPRVLSLIHRISAKSGFSINMYDLFDMLVSELQDSNPSEEKKDLIYSTICNLVIDSLPEGDFWAIDILTKRISYNPFALESSESVATLYDMLSLYIYYLCEKEEKLPKAIRNKIVSWINRPERIDDDIRIRNWKQLFSIARESYNSDQSELYRLYWLCHWEFESFHEVKTYVMTGGFVARWYLAGYLDSENIYADDFPTKLLEKTEYRKYVIDAIDDLFDDDGNINEESVDILPAFFETGGTYMESFMSDDRLKKQLLQVKTSIKQTDMEKRIDRIKDVDLKLIRDGLGKSMKEIISQYQGLARKLEIEDEDTEQKYFYVYAQRNKSDDYYETLGESFANGILNSIRDDILSETIVCDPDRPKESLERIMSLGITHEYEHCLLNLAHDQNKTFQKEVRKFDSTLKHVSGHHLIPFDSVLKKDSLAFNYEIDSLEVLPLDAQQTEEKADGYKRDDGQYIFEGMVVRRDKVIDFVEEEYVTIKMVFRTRIVCHDIYRLDFWSKPKTISS
ncbi:MAG TPA: hypothetical protein PLD07_04640 [Bacillota bacterium]|nr:hypothetical protein [Bacillota bacterium]